MKIPVPTLGDSYILDCSVVDDSNVSPCIFIKTQMGNVIGFFVFQQSDDTQSVDTQRVSLANMATQFTPLKDNPKVPEYHHIPAGLPPILLR